MEDPLSYITVLNTPLNAFGYIPPVAQLCLPDAFATHPFRTLQCFSRAVHDCADGAGGITLPHYFCAAARIKTP